MGLCLTFPDFAYLPSKLIAQNSRNISESGAFIARFIADFVSLRNKLIGQNSRNISESEAFIAKFNQIVAINGYI